MIKKRLKKIIDFYNRYFRGIIIIKNVDPINFEMDQLMKKPSKIYTKFKIKKQLTEHEKNNNN